MGNVTDRFPRLFVVLKVFLLLVIVLLALLLMSIVLLAAAMVYLLVTGGDLSAAPEEALMALTGNVLVSAGYMIVQNVVLVLIAALFVWLVDRKRPVLPALGLGPGKGRGKLLVAGALVNLAFLLVVLCLLFLTGIARLETTGLSLYGASAVAVSFVAIAVGTLFVGFGEEAVFRGYVQRVLGDRFGVAAGLLVTSAIFALFHSLTPFSRLGPLYLVGVFTLSLVLGYLFVLTRSLYASVGFHFFQDFLALQVFDFSGEQTLGACPLFLFSKPREINLGGFFLGGWDDLISIAVGLLLLGALYLYGQRQKKRKVSDSSDPLSRG